MLKPEDIEIPAAGPHGTLSGRGARPRLLPVGGTPIPKAPPAEPLKLFMAEMAGLSGLYSAKVLTYDEFDRSLINLEIRAGANPVLCEVCHARRASVTERGKHICSWGVNNPNDHRPLTRGETR